MEILVGSYRNTSTIIYPGTLECPESQGFINLMFPRINGNGVTLIKEIGSNRASLQQQSPAYPHNCHVKLRVGLANSMTQHKLSQVADSGRTGAESRKTVTSEAFIESFTFHVQHLVTHC